MNSDVDVGTLPISEWRFSVWHICLRFRNNRCRCRISDIADIEIDVDAHLCWIASKKWLVAFVFLTFWRINHLVPYHLHWSLSICCILRAEQLQCLLTRYDDVVYGFPVTESKYLENISSIRIITYIPLQLPLCTLPADSLWPLPFASLQWSKLLIWHVKCVGGAFMSFLGGFLYLHLGHHQVLLSQ